MAPVVIRVVCFLYAGDGSDGRKAMVDRVPQSGYLHASVSASIFSTGRAAVFQLGETPSPVKWMTDAQWKGLLSLELAFPDDFSGFPKAIVRSQIRLTIGNETIVSYTIHSVTELQPIGLCDQ